MNLTKNYLIVLTALSGLTLVGAAAASAQVPGVPGTQPLIPAASPAPSNVLTGGVKTDLTVAEKLLSQGKWADAEGMFRERIVSNPTDLQATVGLGIAMANQFKLDSANSLFDRVLATDPNNSAAYAGKALVMLNRLQSSSGTIRDERDSILKQAETYARQATRLGPSNAQAHAALGQVLQQQGHLDDAASELATATSLDPQMSYAYSALGTIKLDQNSLAEAAANFTRAIALNSGNSTAHYGMGETYLRQGQLDNAIAELNTSLYQFPNSWPVRMALGQAYQKQGNTVAALQQYQLSTLIKPENAGPYLQMADIHLGRSDYELALADLRSGLSQSPYDVNLRQRIADINLQLERPDDAIKEYRAILQLSADDSNAIKGLSQALYLKAQKATVGAMLASNDYSTATKALAEAIKLSPTDMELRLAQLKLASLSGASAPDISTLTAPTNDGDRVIYAQALMAANQFQNANQQLTTVMADLTDAKQLLALGDMAVMIRALDCADAAYKKALSVGAPADRVQAGTNKSAQLRQASIDANKVADELAHKKQWDGAIAKYREALADNPAYALSRLGLAEALDRGLKDSVSTLSESARQYQYYLALATDLTPKDREHFTDEIEKLNDKVDRLKQHEEKSRD